MKEFPLPLLAGEVNSILSKTKRQLRVPIDPQPNHPISEKDIPFQVGDHIWIQENWAAHWSYNDTDADAFNNQKDVENNYWYQADGVSNKGSQGCPASLRGTWRLADTMPKSVSRLHLTIENVWVEQIKDISEDHATAMGFIPEFFKNTEQKEYQREITAKDAFLEDWAQFRGSTDLWTYAIEFSLDTDKSSLHPSYLNDQETLHYQVKCAIKDTQSQHTENLSYTTENKSLSCALEHVLVEEFKADFNDLSADFNQLGEFFKLLDIESIRYIQEYNYIELSFEVRAQHKKVEIEVRLLSD